VIDFQTGKVVTVQRLANVAHDTAKKKQKTNKKLDAFSYRVAFRQFNCNFTTMKP